jgi:hypothetical protein
VSKHNAATAWTSEPPREGADYDPAHEEAWYWVRPKVPTPGFVDLYPTELKSDAQLEHYERSVHPIPSAEVLAAMHEVCEAAKGVMSGVALTPMLDLDAALRALAEARRG